jgi:ArsR family transcriptional regulator
VQGWLRSAGLNPLEPIHFPGRRLMTGIWRGERDVPERTSPRSPALSSHGVSR